MFVHTVIYITMASAILYVFFLRRHRAPRSVGGRATSLVALKSGMGSAAAQSDAPASSRT
jgi:hypothetical protein